MDDTCLPCMELIMGLESFCTVGNLSHLMEMEFLLLKEGAIFEGAE